MDGSTGRAYYDAKTASGKTHNEAMRCLKRRLADHLWRLMISDERRARDGPGRTPGGDYELQRGWLNPDRPLFGQVTSRTRQGRVYEPTACRLTDTEEPRRVRRLQRGCPDAHRRRRLLLRWGSVRSSRLVPPQAAHGSPEPPSGYEGGRDQEQQHDHGPRHSPRSLRALLNGRSLPRVRHLSALSVPSIFHLGHSGSSALGASPERNPGSPGLASLGADERTAPHLQQIKVTGLAPVSFLIGCGVTWHPPVRPSSCCR